MAQSGHGAHERLGQSISAGPRYARHTPPLLAIIDASADRWEPFTPRTN
jgi:hypothetical protein